MNDIVKRHERLAFYGVPTASGGSTTYTFHRMKGFDTISTSKNPKEYSRQYVDEEFEQTDIVGYSPTISFGFDEFKDNAVHSDIKDIFDNEKTGNDAVRPIIMVDMTGATKTAAKRDFAVVADSEGDGTDAYKYSGTFRAKGTKITGTATSADDWQTVTFAEASE